MAQDERRPEVATQTAPAPAASSLSHGSEPEWADVPGFEGLYKVSRDGRVLSMGRLVIQTWRGKEVRKLYKQRLLHHLDSGRRNNARVQLYYALEDNKPPVTIYVYDLVKLAFGKEAADALPRAAMKCLRVYRREPTA